MASFPDDPRLAEIAGELERMRWAAELYDREWRLVWVSDELKRLIGTHDEEAIGYGRHMVEVRLLETWLPTITDESRASALSLDFPLTFEHTPGGKDGVVGLIDFEGTVNDLDAEAMRGVIASLEPRPLPMLWSWHMDYLQADLPPARIGRVAASLRDEAGELEGVAMVYGSGLPATVLNLLARGDESMFERMARLMEPGRRQAAVLFADLQASGALSRRLPGSVYFKLIRAMTTEIDDVIGRRLGIVGKHVGDGVTAFFLADDLGSPSAAARAAIEAAREIGEIASRLPGGLGPEAAGLDPGECPINVGVHWGGTLYMGQVVTGGRLEVTALGDEVNECARIQGVARDGAALASKTLIEHLDADDARAVDLDPESLLYTTVAEMPAADDKARRDAGGIALTEV